MNGQDRVALNRAILHSVLAGVASGSVYLVIAHFYGISVNGASLTAGLITGAIAFVIALVFFAGFMLYFSRKYSRKKA